MTTVAIAGAAGPLGRRLVAALGAADDVSDVVLVDTPATTSERWRVDGPSHGALVEQLRGADAVVNLASSSDPGHDEAALRAVDVDGARRLFEAAAEAGVGHLVHVSTALVYGAHPDNEVPLGEDHPRRGLPGFNAVEHQRELEDWLWAWQEGRPIGLAVLRPAILLGPGIDSVFTRTLEAPRIPVVRGHRPPWQFLHPDDAVAALVHVLRERLTGAYNVAAEGWLSIDEVAAVVGRRTLEVPEEVAYTTAARLWSLGWGEQPPGLVALFVHPCVVSPARLIATGWRPQHSNRDAVATTAAEHAPYVTLLGHRAQRAVVWRTVAASAALLTVVAGQLVRIALRRRRAATDRRRVEGARRGSSLRA